MQVIYSSSVVTGGHQSMQFWGHQSVQDIIVLHVFIQLLYNMLNKTVQFQLNCSLLLSKVAFNPN